MNNPYIWNAVDPDLCYGRDVLLADLGRGLAQNPRCSFGLAGGRRMGKTTLLRRVECDIRDRIDKWRDSGLLVIPVFVDGLALPRPLDASHIWELLFRQLRTPLGEPPSVPMPQNFEMFKNATSVLLADVELQPRVVVLFDEIEPILVREWAGAFLSHWRALLSNTPDLSEYFTAVFAGARELDALRRDIGSPLRDILEWRSLRPLAYDDACRLMQEPIGRRWDDSFLASVHRETGGHPMLLQYVMQQICRHRPEAAPAGRYTMEHLVERTVEDFLRERRWQFDEWWERYCSPTAQRVYARLHEAREDVQLKKLVLEFGFGEANDAVEILQHVGLAAESDGDEGLALRCIGDMFRRWYERYGVLVDAPQHDPELHAQLAEVGDAPAEKYLSAWRIYQTDMPNYSGVVGELRDMLTHLLDCMAPIEEVAAEAGFQLERGQTRPTRRQRVRHAARRRQNSERAKEVASDFDLLEMSSDRLARVVTDSYRHASGQTHTTTTREQAYRALKQWEHIFAQLLPVPRSDTTSGLGERGRM